jgi:hypothetical protein
MADDIVISARVDTTEALRDLAKLEQDRTVDVEIQPINVDATIKAIDQRLSRLNTQLVIAVAEDNTKSVKSLQAKIDALTRRKTQLTIDVDADTRAATSAIDRAAQDQTATVKVKEDGAGAARAAVDKAAEDQTATVKVKAESDGSLDALLGGLGNLPGVGGLDSALSAGRRRWAVRATQRWRGRRGHEAGAWRAARSPDRSHWRPRRWARLWSGPRRSTGSALPSVRQPRRLPDCSW